MQACLDMQEYKLYSNVDMYESCSLCIFKSGNVSCDENFSRA